MAVSTSGSEVYIPTNFARKMRVLAVKMWAFGLFIVSFWVAVIVAAPLLAASGLPGAAKPIYTFYSFLCHQLPERSFYAEGHPFAVCSRCFGVYFGLVLGFLVYPLWQRIDETQPIARFWLFLSLIPIGVDWTLGVLGIWENTHFSRFLTGTILGAACATFIIPALVEIRQNMAYKRSQSPQTSVPEQ